MTSPGKSRHVEVKDGGQTVAAAEVMTVRHAGGTVRTSLLPSSGHTPPGCRASLGRCGDGPAEAQASSRLEATIPFGDAESLARLRERTRDTVTRPAGSAGNDLIVEHVIEFRAGRESLAALSAGLDVFLAGVHCDLAEIDRRERGGQIAAAARAGRTCKPT